MTCPGTHWHLGQLALCIMAFTPSTVFLASLISVSVTKIEASSSQPTLSPESLETLEFVAVVSRHGNRSPSSTYPNDPYPYNNRTFWPNGPTELTNCGRDQMYHTGQYLKSRYPGFKNPVYITGESEVTYNPYNRDFSSAACLTAGMYPTVGRQVWNCALRWQPVIQSLRSYDICDLRSNGECPRFEQLSNAQEKLYNEDTDNYKELLSNVSSNTGKNYTMLSDLYAIYDTLHMQELNCYKLPLWTKSLYPEPLRSIALRFLTQVYAGDNELTYLGAGLELKYISDLLSKKANGIDKEKKFYIEAAHDCTLISMLRALGNNDTFIEVKPGAFLAIELHYVKSEYIVKILYFKSSYDTDPGTINVIGCPNPCKLTDFIKFIDAINPPDWNKACQKK